MPPNDPILSRLKRYWHRLSHSPTPQSLEAEDLIAEVEALYTLLYQAAHDPDATIELAGLQTEDAFSQQWESYEEGQYLLSDPWFREHVCEIITKQELQIQPEWFKGKRVLDAGCGNGRWAYGLAKLGALVTAVDVNASAIASTQRAFEEAGLSGTFLVNPIETLDTTLKGQRFDLVWSWGVLHHCRSFTKALGAVSELVAEDGILYLYLYGRESLSLKQDIQLFRERIRYNTLTTVEDQEAFLLKKANGDRSQLHNVHDIYAPLVNRRFTWDDIKSRLGHLGFREIERTIDHTELWIRAMRGTSGQLKKHWGLAPHDPPYWFEHHSQ